MKTDLQALSNISRGRWSLIAAAALTVFAIVWAIANFTVEGMGFARLVSGELQGFEVVASGLTQIFAALVLVFFLAEKAGWRLRWIAGGLAVMSLGHLIFGYVEPLIQGDPAELNESLYEVLVTQTLACWLFAMGLFPRTQPGFFTRATTIIPISLIAGYILVFEFLEGESWMPALTHADSTEQAVELGTSFAWLTSWHWVFSAPLLVLAMVAAVGAFRQSRRGLLQGWLLFAMVLMAGSVLHEYLWPYTYDGIMLTTADVLHLMLGVVAAVGGIVELRRIASERTALFASEQERTRRLGELNTLRADFSAMVAHELDSPLAAVRRLTEMLGVEGLNEGTRSSVLSMIDGEISNLNALVADVRSAAMIERDDFEIEPQPLPLGKLLEDARAYASTMSGNHPVRISPESSLDGQARVLADPKRIGQVLRNLLSNAAKYSPEGTLIELRVKARDKRLRIEVADRGPGIHPNDVSRIFEKFGRGRDRDGRKVAGVGLGLYLSCRIIRAHGGELTVDTKLGEGSAFGFDLELAQ